MSLNTRLLLITALLIGLAIAVAAALGLWRGERFARSVAEESLATSQSVQDYFQQRRLRELELISALMASDRPFVSYVAQALNTPAGGLTLDGESIRDLLNERREQLGFDHAAVLDRTGRLVVDTSRIVQGTRDVSKLPGVADAIRDLAPKSAIWIDEGRALLVAIVPLLAGQTLEAFLVTGMAIDEEVAREIAKASRTDLVYVVPAGPNQYTAVASTLDLAQTQQLVASLGERHAEFKAAASRAATELNKITIGGQVWRARVSYFGDPANDALQVALVSPDQQRVVASGLTNTMLWSGGAAVLLLMLVPLAISRTVLRPLNQLADGADRAGRGELPQPIRVVGSGEIARLGRSFNRLLADLREQRDVENYIAELWQLRSDSGVRRDDTSPTTLAVQHSNLVPESLFGGRYEIAERVASGGMGVVYRAYDRELRETVALKTLSAAAQADPGLIEHLKSEIRTARRITHTNVVRTFDFGQAEGISFISMEFLHGMTLREALLRTGRVRLYAGLRIARQICAGLGAAHKCGVLHRDLKPSNVMLALNGTAKIMDFGISRPSSGRVDARHRESTFAGTPTYASPEQLQGRDASEASDIYSLGVMFSEMFTGNLPIEGKDTFEIAIGHVERPPIHPSVFWPEIPPLLEALILRCLEKDPSNRYPNMDALRDDLERCRT